MTTARSGLGQLGERLAADHLTGLGFAILGRNVRFRSGEIDLVVRDGATLVFVEVRTRRGTSHGTPEESITPGKQRRMLAAAHAYLMALDEPTDDWRIDVVAVEMTQTGTLFRVEHILGAIEG